MSELELQPSQHQGLQACHQYAMAIDGDSDF